MTKPLLVNLEPAEFSATAKHILRACYDYKELDAAKPMAPQIKHATVIVSRLSHSLDSELMACAPNLKFIASATTGTNHIDEDYALSKGVEIICLKDEKDFLTTITATAEHAWGLILALVRNYKSAFRSVECFEWQRDRFPGVQLSGCVLGVVGLGRLGTMVAGYGSAFGMDVVYADPIVESAEYERLPLDGLLKKSDIISVHVPLTPETVNLLSNEEFALMKRKSFLVNTSRGDVINQSALLTALEKRHLAGAALDVISDEHTWAGVPPSNQPLINYAREHPNLVLTPHIGGLCPQVMRETEIFIAEKLVSKV